MDTPVKFEAEKNELAGVYTTPGTDTYPAALILGGSGPLDRNGDVKKMKLSISRLLAEMLAEAGWASLRYDKRGVGESTGDYLSTGLYDELADARAAHAWLGSQPGVTKTVVIGHSMGASLAAELGASEEETAAVVMLAGIATLGEDVLSWQTQKVKDHVVPKPVAAIMRLFGTDVVKQQAKSVAKLKGTTTDVARISLVKTNARWMREMIAYDPVPTLQTLQVPVLAITGSKDIQVNPADLEVIARVATGATTVEISDVDHLLRHEPAAHSNLRNYRNQVKKPIDPRVTETIKTWLATLA